MQFSTRPAQELLALGEAGDPSVRVIWASELADKLSLDAVITVKSAQEENK